MNSRAKGNRAELKAEKELEADGWLVCRVKGSTKWNKAVDFFGLWDLIAKRGQETKWVQVKTNRKPPFKEYEQFQKKHCCEHERCEVWVWKDREGFKKYVMMK